MRILLEIVAGYAVWIYLACALAAAWYLRVVYLARKERRATWFPLEKEAAFQRVYTAAMASVVIAFVLAGTYFVANRLIEIVPEPAGAPILGTPTPVLLATPTPTAPPTPTPTPQPPTPTPTRRQPTPTPPPPPTPTPSTTSPQCPDPRAVITSPGVGAVLSGPTEIVGTAQHENFQFYKLEFGIGNNPQQWSYFGGQETPVVNGVLGMFDASALPNGTYTIRVVVVDKTGNYPPPCQVTVIVQR